MATTTTTSSLQRTSPEKGRSPEVIHPTPTGFESMSRVRPQSLGFVSFRCLDVHRSNSRRRWRRQRQRHQRRRQRRQQQQRRCRKARCRTWWTFFTLLAIFFISFFIRLEWNVRSGGSKTEASSLRPHAREKKRFELITRVSVRGGSLLASYFYY